MSKVAGFFVKLTSARSNSFYGRFDDVFAEPVPEFSHSRNVPLVCFIINPNEEITHIGLGKRGFWAGTDLRRLNIQEIFQLEKPILAAEIVNSTSSRIKHHLTIKLENGGLISKKSFEEFLVVFLDRVPEAVPILRKYSIERMRRIERLSDLAKRSLAEQKEAVLTAMNIAGIDRKKAQGWDYLEGEEPKSFLDGIESVKLREDSVIINDLTNFPDFDLIKTTEYSSSIFKNEQTHLTVLLANRLPLEELIGTDLIYYNEDFECFIMVQYKMMEKEGDQNVFRVPSKQLNEEISRMDSISKYLYKQTNKESINDFRISNDPFFIKLCPRLVFAPDNIGLSKGMYIPLEYLKLLQNDDSIKGSRGGKAISYGNIGRYFDNTSFKTIIEGGWIGTNSIQSEVLSRIIKNILENGRTAVVAIKKTISQGVKNNNENRDNETLP